jgi:hypothetical protein
LILIGLAGLVVVVVCVLLLSGGGNDKSSTSTTSTKSSLESAPAIVSADDLRALSASLGHPLYWLGERPGTRLEMRHESNGDVLVRYLTGDAKAGDTRPRYITVGTYPTPDAVATLRRAASQEGAEVQPVPKGGIVLASPTSPENVYVAFPGSDYQVEVFTPKAGEGLELVQAGKVTPVG